MDIKAKFEDAQGRVKSLPSKPGNEALLKLYSLYKQSSAGDCGTKRPGMMDFVGRAKWDAWSAIKGMKSEDAMTSYVDYVDSLGA
jgi:acyl-CoA-binding protein